MWNVEDAIGEQLSFLAEAGDNQEFVFVTQVRKAAQSTKGNCLDRSELSAIKEVVTVTSRSAVSNTEENVFTYRLMSFIVYFGPIELGHYVTYSHDLQSYQYVIVALEGPLVSLKTRSDFISSARKDSQLLVYKQH